MDYYIGLDLSLTATGVCIIGEDNTQFFTIKTKPEKYRSPEERFEYIKNEVIRLLPDCPFVVFIAIEDYSYGSVGQSFSKAELHGLIKNALFTRSYEFTQYSPNSLKKFASGKGNSGKDVVIKCVYQHWGHDLTDNNQADACVLAHMARCADGVGKYTAYQHAVINIKPRLTPKKKTRKSE